MAKKQVEDEKPARRSRKAAAPADEKPARRSRKAPAAETEKPARRSRKATTVEVEKPTRRSRKAPAVPKDEVSVKATRKRKATSVAEAAEPKYFNPYESIDETLDNIEKHVGLSDSSMDKTEKRQSTGCLALDLILGGGITAGWYTNFGQEQSCKTTAAVTMLSAALNSDVPILAYFDFEGCLTYDAQVTINGKKQHLGDLFAGIQLVPYMGYAIEHLGIKVETPCGDQLVTHAVYKGPKPITKIVLENGYELEGYKHPVLVLNQDQTLEWKKLEELTSESVVVVKP